MLSEGLAVTLYVGAARADVVPEKLPELRVKILEALAAYREGAGDESDVMNVIDEVMGSGWAPTGEWKTQLDALGFTRRQSG